MSVYRGRLAPRLREQRLATAVAPVNRGARPRVLRLPLPADTPVNSLGRSVSAATMRRDSAAMATSAKSVTTTYGPHVLQSRTSRAALIDLISSAVTMAAAPVAPASAVITLNGNC